MNWEIKAREMVVVTLHPRGNFTGESADNYLTATGCLSSSQCRKGINGPVQVEDLLRQVRALVREVRG